MITRGEHPADASAIRSVHLAAFPGAAEADLVDQLRANGAVTLSMVAELETQVVGHVLLSPVLLGEGRTQLEGLGLAPVAVLPQHQRHGIGSQLVRDALLQVNAGGWPYVVVLGSPAYYSRFGFEPARQFGVSCKWKAAGDAFMLLPFDRNRVGKTSGLARYRPEFDAFG